jgi:hypothetical protein
MISQNEILENVTTIRANSEVFLTDACYLYKKIDETVENGQSTPVYAEPLELSCRLIVRSGADRANIAAQERVITQVTFTGFYRLQLPFGTLVNEDDKITMVDISTNVVKTYQVIYVPLQHKMMGAFIIGIKEEL